MPMIMQIIAIVKMDFGWLGHWGRQVMALRVCVVVLLLACMVTALGWLATTSSLEAENEQYAYSLEEINRLAGMANEQVSLSNEQIEQANANIGQLTADIGQLEQELAQSEESLAFWWGRANPREFESLAELKAWLAEDDSDTTLYIFGNGCLSNYDCDDYAAALVYNALYDGYLVSTQIVGNHMLNSTIIGNSIYYIEPQTDAVWLWGRRD